MGVVVGLGSGLDFTCHASDCRLRALGLCFSVGVNVSVRVGSSADVSVSVTFTVTVDM